MEDYGDDVKALPSYLSVCQADDAVTFKHNFDEIILRQGNPGDLYLFSMGFGKSGAGMKGADVRGNTKIVKDLGGKSNSEFDRKMAESDAKNNKNIVLFVGIPTLGLIALLVAIASQ